MFSGIAMVLTLAIPLRKVYGLEDFITMRHLDNLGKLLLASALIVTYSYLSEGFFAWYSGNEFECRNRLEWKRDCKSTARAEFAGNLHSAIHHLTQISDNG